MTGLVCPKCASTNVHYWWRIHKARCMDCMYVIPLKPKVDCQQSSSAVGGQCIPRTVGVN